MTLDHHGCLLGEQVNVSLINTTIAAAEKHITAIHATSLDNYYARCCIYKHLLVGYSEPENKLCWQFREHYGIHAHNVSWCILRRIGVDAKFGNDPSPRIRSKVNWVLILVYNVSKGAKIRNQYNQVPHLTQDTNGKVTNSQLDTTNDSQEVSTFPAGDHKAHIYSST